MLPVAALHNTEHGYCGFQLLSSFPLLPGLLFCNHCHYLYPQPAPPKKGDKEGGKKYIPKGEAYSSEYSELTAGSPLQLGQKSEIYEDLVCSSISKLLKANSEY